MNFQQLKYGFYILNFEFQILQTLSQRLLLRLNQNKQNIDLNYTEYSTQMYAQTLQALSSKVQNAKKLSLQQKRRQKQQAELKLLLIQRILECKKKQQNEQLDSCKQNINILGKLGQQTLRNFAIKSQKQQQLVAVLREEVQNQIQKDQRQHDQRVQNILQESEGRIRQHIEDSQRKTKKQKDRGDSLLNQLSKRINNLQKDFKSESQTRKQNCNKITLEIKQEILRFRDQIQDEKQKCKSSQKKMNSMMYEIQTKIRTQIEVQSEKRKKNNQSILKLIQIACNKLQQAMQT